MENKIYEELYSKEDLEKTINSIYENGLINLETNSKNKIYEYINEVLNKINSYISTEVLRLSNEITS